MAKSDNRWKRAEREIAELLGGARIPNNGYGQPDVVAGRLAVQVKTRLSLPAWFTGAVDQAIRDAAARSEATSTQQQPVVVVNLVSQGKKARRFLIADLDHVLTDDDGDTQ